MAKERTSVPENGPDEMIISKGQKEKIMTKINTASENCEIPLSTQIQASSES